MLVTQLRIWATSLSMPTTAPWLRGFFLILLLCWSQSMFNRGCFDKRAPIKKWILHSCYSRFCKNLAAVVTDRSDGCTNRAKASSSQTVTCWNFLPKLMPQSFRELSFWFAARTHSGPSKPVFSRTILSNFTCQADYIWLYMYCPIMTWTQVPTVLLWIEVSCRTQQKLPPDFNTWCGNWRLPKVSEKTVCQGNGSFHKVSWSIVLSPW